MAIRILTDEQRARYGRFTGTPTPDTLARHFHLDAADLTLLSASTFLGFSGGLLMKTMRERGRRQGIAINLPDDWKTAFAGAIALPVSATTPVLHIIEADES